MLSALKDGSARGGSGRSATHWRAALVAAQIAISVVLLSAAGLLVRSVWNLLNTDPGFNQRGGVVARLWLPPPTDPNARQTYRVPANRIQFTRNLAEQLSAQPGIEAAAVGAGQSIPFTPWRASDLVVEGRTLEPGAAPQARVASVTPGYFDVLGLQLHRGRLLRAGDDHVNPVAVIDEQAARLLWPNDDAVGRRFAVGEGTAPQWITVVGVVSAMNTEGFDAPFAAHVYVSAYHRPSLDISVLLRSPLPSEVLAPMLRDVVRNIDPDLPVFSVRALEDIVVHTQAQRRFAFAVLVFFAVVALLLAALGVAGVTGLVTTQRRREFGVRVALGASGREMAKLVFGFGFRMALAGVVVGLVPAAVLCTALGSLLYGVRPIDPLTIGTMVIALAITVLGASLPAARRAARSNPSDALRAE